MKNLKNLGKTLSKNEQKMINGGSISCNSAEECGEAPFDQIFYQAPACYNGFCTYGAGGI